MTNASKKLYAIEVNQEVRSLINAETEAGIRSVMRSLAHEFIDVTSVSAPKLEKHFLHALTGRTLIVSARWLKKKDD